MYINNKKKEDGQKMVMDYFNDPTNENKEKVVLAFLPLVNHVINKIPIDSYQNILTKEDLFQNGVMGLLSSLDKYDPELNTAFKSYCYTRVHGSIIDAIRKNNTISRDQIKKYKTIDQSRDALSKKLYREPSVNEIANDIGTSVSNVNQAINNYELNSNISLDSPIASNTDDDSLSYHEMLPSQDDSPEIKLDKKEQKTILKNSIEDLPEKQRLVLALYYYEELKISEIGSILNVSDGRVSQILKSTLELLKSKLSSLKTNKSNFSIV